MYYDNFRSLLEDLDDDFELMDEIIKDLEKLIEETKINIENALRFKDSKSAESAIHKLKGALLNFRITDEVNILQTLEEECRNGSLSSVENNIKIVFGNLSKLSLDYKRYSKDNKLS